MTSNKIKEIRKHKSLFFLFTNLQKSPEKLSIPQSNLNHNSDIIFEIQEKFMTASLS